MEAGPFGKRKMTYDEQKAQTCRTCGKVFKEAGILKKLLTQIVNTQRLDNSMNKCWVTFLLRFAIDELTFPKKCEEHLLHLCITPPYFCILGFDH